MRNRMNKDITDDEVQTLVYDGKENTELGAAQEKNEETETLAGDEVSQGAKKENSRKRLAKRENEQNRRGDVFLLPKGVYAHFLLIDIAGPVKKVRGIPRYLQLERAKTLIGRYSKAHVHLDDPDTVEKKHAKVIYEEREGKNGFVIYPIDHAQVTLNEGIVSSEGVVLKSGDRVEIGSADLIFFHRDLEKD